MWVLLAALACQRASRHLQLASRATCRLPLTPQGRLQTREQHETQLGSTLVQDLTVQLPVRRREAVQCEKCSTPGFDRQQGTTGAAGISFAAPPPTRQTEKETRFRSSFPSEGMPILASQSHATCWVNAAEIAHLVMQSRLELGQEARPRCFRPTHGCNAECLLACARRRTRN